MTTNSTNATGSTNAASSLAPNHVKADFVKGKKGGVIAFVTLGGVTRAAFPDKRGPQPKDGESWNCFVIGANPKGTVWFVRCISLIGETPKAEVAERAPVKAKRQEKTSFGFKPATAPDAEARVAMLLSPGASSTGSFENLGLVMAQNLMAPGDEHAAAIRGQIAGVQSAIAATRKGERKHVATLRRLLVSDFEKGIEKGKRLIKMRGMRENLAKGDRLYASMCSQVSRLKAQAEKDGVELDLPFDFTDEQMHEFKFSLDCQRAEVTAALGDRDWKSEKVSINKVMNKLEREVMDSINGLWGDASEALAQVNEVVGAIESVVAVHNERQGLLHQLADLANQYEARLKALVS